MGNSSKILKEKKVPADQSVQLSTLESLLENNLKFASKPFKIKTSTSALSGKEQLASLNRFKMIVSLVRDSTYWILKIIEVRNYSDAELKRVFDLLKAMFTIEEMRLCKIRLLRAEALDLVIKALKSQAPLKKVSNKDAGKEVKKNPS
ncbi:hypothetical protein Goshw_015027 [Gossypium schwendimanii]|uniref:Uncharacterized protein n=1 Tax=Gossypium schwendimanii TaxID=34291 RepID=A0A7J9L9Z3_GOSSC|nr:hypothetical protein [Gossypium schwendimanii]